MALHDLKDLGGSTRVETATGFRYALPLEKIETFTDGNYMVRESRTDSKSEIVYFDRLSENYGTANINEYADFIAINEYYHQNAVISNIYNSAYGEVLTSGVNPVVAGNAIYGFIPANFREFTAIDGTTGVTGNKMSVFSGTSLGAYGTIRSFRSLNYKTAQGALIRFSCRFNESEANTWSGAGAFNISDEVSFGYNGTTFGIWHRYGGYAEVQYLQLTAGASGAETATVTINNTVYSIPITAGTVQQNAREIDDYLEANAPEINVDQVDDTIRIIFNTDGNKTGTFSYSSTGTSAGTFTEITQGVTKTSVHYPMSEWNIRKNGFQGFNPAFGNTYQIELQNGFGDVKFYVEDAITGNLKEVHVIKWANTNTETNFTNPSMRLGIYATALGAVSGVNVELAYIAGFLNGKERRTRNPRSYSNTKTIGTTATNILTLRNANIYNGYANQVEIEPLKITLSNDSTKTAIFELRSNATVSGFPDFQPVGNNLASLVDITGVTVSSNGRLLDTYTVAKGDSVEFSLKELEIRQPPSLNFVISGRQRSGGSAADLSATITWYEDV